MQEGVFRLLDYPCEPGSKLVVKFSLGVALLQVLLRLAKQLDAELRSCLVSGVQAGLEGPKNEDDIDVLVALVCRQEKIDHFLEDFVL